MNVFMARQPIFNKHSKVFAYELLFRCGNDGATCEIPGGDEATLNVLSNALLVFGLDKLTGRKPAFVNFTENLLKKEIAKDLPNELIAVEILENVVPSNELYDKCAKLKKLGYLIVLDDFIYNPSYKSLFPLVDIIKVDFIQTKGPERGKVIADVDSPRIKFLAEKVETRQDLDEALRYGYQYFQGYYFQKPELLIRRDVPSQRYNYFKIMNEVNKPDLDFSKIETIINHDVGFSFKLLKYINSSFFGFSKGIKSIKQALVMLGQRELARWITVLLLREYSVDKPPELVASSVVRAKFGEFLAKLAKRDDISSDAFFLGMFSLIDAITDRPLPEIIGELPISDDIKDVLLGQTRASDLADIYAMVRSYEKADWGIAYAIADRLKINEEKIPEAYLKALQWADGLQ